MALYCRQYTESMEYFQKFLELTESVKDRQSEISEYLTRLMAKKQYRLALSLFEDEKSRLKQLVRPVYYALMFYMQDEYPKEYKRMGKELEETVQEIIKKIENLRAAE